MLKLALVFQVYLDLKCTVYGETTLLIWALINLTKKTQIRWDVTLLLSETNFFRGILTFLLNGVNCVRYLTFNVNYFILGNKRRRKSQTSHLDWWRYSSSRMDFTCNCHVLYQKGTYHLFLNFVFLSYSI